MILTGKIEQLTGTTDGANTVFTTPGGEAYEPGSVMVFLRGIPREDTDATQGWTETDPANGVITMNTAPYADDNLFAHYNVDSGSVETEITPINAALSTSEELSASIEGTTLAAALVPLESLSTPLDDEDQLTVTIEDVTEIACKIETC